MSKHTESVDVFSSLNDFLSKGDESFSFSSEMETPLSELETDGENDIKITEVKKTDIIVSDSSTKVDLSKIDYNFIPTSKNTTTRKRSARYSRNNQINDDDLSIVNVPQKKTRRKKAEVSIELSTIDNSTEEDNTVSRTRSGKARVSLTKGQKNKANPAKKVNTKNKKGHLSLEDAMALVEQPLTSSSIVDLTYGTARPLSPEVDLTGRAIPSLFQGVDLTGGTTPPHSTSPLFKPLKKYIKPNDDDFDIDLVNIKLKLDGKIEIHTIRKDQKFLEIFKTVADTHNISTNDVLIYNDSKRIHYDDTPYSIDYRASIFFTCRIMEKSGPVEVTETFRRYRNENEIEIKVQSDKWSRPLKIMISKVDKFKVLLDIIAETVTFKVEQMRLKFDGEIVDINDTPLDLEFEGGEIVDCKIIN